MKKLFLFLAFACCGYSVSAQDMTYRPFFRESTPTPTYQSQSGYNNNAPRQYQQNQPQQQSQKLRATAYQLDSEGDYIKIPIQVTVTTYIYPTGDSRQEAKVTSYYRNNGYGGQWKNCTYGVALQECQSVYGNEMEQSFMFKANLPLIGWIYFDL